MFEFIATYNFSRESIGTFTNIILSTEQSRPLEPGLRVVLTDVVFAGTRRAVGRFVSLKLSSCQLRDDTTNTYPEEYQTSWQNLQLTESEMIFCEIFSVYHEILVVRSHFEGLHYLDRTQVNVKLQKTRSHHNFQVPEQRVRAD